MKNSKANSSLEFSKYLRKIDIPLYGSRSERSVFFEINKILFLNTVKCFTAIF